METVYPIGYLENSGAPTEMTKLAFRQRFTALEKAKIYLAAVHDPSANEELQMRAASVRSILDDLASASVIQPDREAVRTNMELLEQFGLIETGRASEILDVPISDEERP